MRLNKPQEKDYAIEGQYKKALGLYLQDMHLLYGEYDRDQDGNILSCCGDILDEDVMICPTCKEHC